MNDIIYHFPINAILNILPSTGFLEMRADKGIYVVPVVQSPSRKIYAKGKTPDKINLTEADQWSEYIDGREIKKLVNKNLDCRYLAVCINDTHHHLSVVE